MDEFIRGVITFLCFFSALSILRLLILFIKALLSNPPKKIELDRRALIYYGLCVSFLLTTLYNIIT